MQMQLYCIYIRQQKDIHMKRINLKYYLLLLFAAGLIMSCSDDDEPMMPMDMDDEEEEEISQVVLTFTPDNGEDAVVAIWLDADGDGSAAPSIDAIELAEGVGYTLDITLTNTLGSTDEDITSEILEEADEHQFFFSFTDGIFSDPSGNGNVDNRNDPINYNDQDSNGLPLGLSTAWTAGGHTDNPGEFNVVLKHQPDEKSATSDVSTGGTDIDITFPLSIAEGDEEEEEVINQILVTFTPEEGEAVTATWFDEDGEGVGSPAIEDIELVEGTTYEMSITLSNTLGTEVEDVTAEIQEEDDEHMFFFSFTDGIFSDPTGDGNVDSRNDPLNYNDQDDNGLPVGLSTTWTAGGHTDTPGEFNIVLKHQPGQKSATSDVSTGGTDVDITFPLSIEEGNEEEEVINEIILTFTPTGEGDPVSASFVDPDGEGVANPTIEDINLAANTTYEMSISFLNTLGMEAEDITEEIQEEDDEHMLFYEFTADIFSDPTGDGNIDNRADPLVYNDQDDNGQPVGLLTNWTTGGATSSSGNFRVLLKHQPGGQKTATSDSTVGGTDVDIAFSINIQ